MIKLYGIPNCDTVKKARMFLEKNAVSVEFVDFKKSPPETKDILRWREFLKELPVNSKGATYRKLKEEYEALSPDQKIEFLRKNSSMIKRPVLEKDGKVLFLGFSEEAYKNLLS